MGEKKHSADDGKAAPGVVRRRLVGAAAMLLFAFVLWHLGESAPPAQVHLSSPPAAQWQEPGSEMLRDAESRLADGLEVLDNADNAAGHNDGDGFAVVESIDATLAADGGEVADAVVDNNEVAIELPTVVAEKPDEQPVRESETASESTNETSGKSFSAGVFAKPENADSLAAKINTAGWETKISIYQADGKTLHKVIVVNLPDAVAVAAAEEFVKTPAAKPSLFVVQVGAYENSSKADTAAKKLQNDGYTTDIFKDNLNGVLLHKVRAVGYQSRADAEEAERNLRGLNYVNAYVVNLQ